MKMNCIVVDDEPASRDILEKFIADCPSLELVSVCKNAFEAMDAVNNGNVNLIFLDINMPRLSGLTFYKSLNHPPCVVFTTAYPEYAVEGFEVDAVDYLLKPFTFDRFLKAVNRAMDKYGNEQQKAGSASVLLKSDKKLYHIKLSDIHYLEAFGDYVKVYYNDQAIMVHETFQNMMNRLPEKEFVRVHKSFGIAINKIEVIEGNEIKLKNKTIPIGQTYRSAFLYLLKSNE